MKKALKAFCPLLLYPILFIPYSFFNSKFLVDWLGCGCEEGFNANRFTLLFWGIIAVLTTVLSALFARRCEKIAERIVYPIIVGVISLAVSYFFFRLMMWK